MSSWGICMIYPLLKSDVIPKISRYNLRQRVKLSFANKMGSLLGTLIFSNLAPPIFYEGLDKVIVQPADIGRPTGNRKKLSCCQAQLSQAKCLAVAFLLSISCRPSYVRRLYTNVPSKFHTTGRSNWIVHRKLKYSI